MRKFIVIFLLMLAVGISDICAADTFVIPLPVGGSYSAGTKMPFDFDLEQTLIEVHEVRFYCKGSVTAGLSYFSTPFSWAFEAWMPASPGYWIARGPSAGESTYPDPEPFEGESLFTPLLSPTWDFMLDGTGSGWVELPDVMYIPENPPKKFPTGYIESAHITIEATVARVPLISHITCVLLSIVLPGLSVFSLYVSRLRRLP